MDGYPNGINAGLTRCPACGCNVSSAHVPGSRDCDESRIERDYSRGQ